MIDKESVSNEMMQKNPTVTVELKFTELIHIVALRESLDLDKGMSPEDIEVAVNRTPAISMISNILDMVKKTAATITDDPENSAAKSIVEMEKKMDEAKAKVREMIVSANTDNLALGKKLVDAFNKAVQDNK